MNAMFGGTALVALFLCTVGMAGSSFAQVDNTPVVFGTSRTIHSQVLGEDRTLLIHLPEDYGKSDKKYPVLYKLDGERDVFLQTASVVNYLIDSGGRIPDHIIVGITNTDRMRDMDPEHGADTFIQFLKTELVPFIDKNYRTNSFKVLCGQSLSSIFALYSFLKQPDLFNGYILSSFGLYKESLASAFEKELRKSQELKKVSRRHIFITNGKLDSYDPDGSIARRGTQFLDSLKGLASVSVLLNYKTYDDEGHVPFPSTYDGLKWIYREEP